MGCPATLEESETLDKLGCRPSTEMAAKTLDTMGCLATLELSETLDVVG